MLNDHHSFSQGSSGKPEIEWTKQYLLPLLHSMRVLGIFDVQYHGGSSERGKDITFSYQNPIGFTVFCAVQVKYPKLTGKANELEQLRGEIHAAFEQPYKRSPNESRYIQQLYLVAPEGFTPEAKEQIQNIPEFAQRSIVYVDQPRLDQWTEMVGAALLSKRESLIAALNYAIIEIPYALAICEIIEAEPSSMRMFRLDFLDRLTALPFKNPQISTLARKAWFRLSTVNETALYVAMVIPIGIGVDEAKALRRRQNREGNETLSTLLIALSLEIQAFQV